jgi:hypothetical protein
VAGRSVPDEGKMKACFLTVALLLCTGCAGKDFIRPPMGTLVVGKTTRAEIVGSVGAPERESVIVKNGYRVSMLTYVYAAALGSPLYSGVVPGRIITLGFHENTLVSQLFASSFRDDNSDFDEEKVSQIVLGQTSLAQVRDLFGRPGGEEMFPLQADGTLAWAYAYEHFRNTHDLKKRTYRKTLVIRFGKEGVVEDYQLSISGEKF